METYFKNKELNEAMGSKAISTSKQTGAFKHRAGASMHRFVKYDLDNISEILSSIVVQRREKKGWSQTDMSKNSGINRSIITRLEAGTVPSLVNLLQICNALEIDIDELLRA